jgi:L-asparaginase II
MSATCEVSLIRGGMVESVHDIAVVVVGPGGGVVAETPGASALPVFLRSAAKPFQAEPAVRAGVLERLGLDDRHLALACASHVGRPEHVALAGEMLAAAGLGPGDLDCGTDDDGNALGHMCSGNHALGLALCVCEGWPTVGYLDPAHPLQVAMRRALQATAGVVAEEAGDGCGMRAYRRPLERYAASFGALGAATGALGRCAAAMRAHPDLVRGPGEIDTELMRAEPGLVAKVGAEATIGVGLADGRGLALKVRDGAWRAMEPAAVHATRAAFGLAAAGEHLARHATPPILDARGHEVGSLVIRLALMGETS